MFERGFLYMYDKGTKSDQSHTEIGISYLDGTFLIGSQVIGTDNDKLQDIYKQLKSGDQSVLRLPANYHLADFESELNSLDAKFQSEIKFQVRKNEDTD